jgi:hypothetical protein
MAAGLTYTAIATTTLGSATTSYTFSSISGSYTDLVLISTGNANNPTNPRVQFNGDTSNSYSITSLIGDGSAVSSARASNNAGIILNYQAYMSSASNDVVITNIMSYSNATTYKTVLSRSSAQPHGVDATVGLWRNTSAITSITISTGSANTFSVGNTFTLYGIAAA